MPALPALPVPPPSRLLSFPTPEHTRIRTGGREGRTHFGTVLRTRIPDTPLPRCAAQVFLAPCVRGTGLGKALVTCVRAVEELHRCTHFLLYTADAHGLYGKFGWKRPLNEPHLWMDAEPRGQL